MNVLFITVADMRDVDTHGIYSDLMREFLKKGNEVYIASPAERRKKMATTVLENKGSQDWHKHLHILKIKTGNIQKTNIIEKGISSFLLETQLTNGIKKFFNKVKFDLVLYTTPPITIVKPVQFVKKRDGAFSYLMLKDIFPQNAVDIGILSQNGLKNTIYKFYRKKEKKLYEVSDMIGCMSQANIDYILKHNPEIDTTRVEVCPNSIEVIDKSVDDQRRIAIRAKYDIPFDKKVFIYGGNLGKPQDIPFLIKCLEKVKSIREAFFLVVGNGTEYGLLESYAAKDKQANFKLMQRLPENDYNTLVGACDVGMIFLDYRFTIPNFPSRLLSYMQAKLPVLAVTDLNTDIGRVIVDGGFGWWCESNNADNFANLVKKILTYDLCSMKEKGYFYLNNYYSVEKTFQTIVKHLKD